MTDENYDHEDDAAHLEKFYVSNTEARVSLMQAHIEYHAKYNAGRVANATV